MRKRVLFIANSLDNAYKFQQSLSDFDVETAAGSTAQIDLLTSPEQPLDLLIFEAKESAWPYLEDIEELVKMRNCPLLIIIEDAHIDRLKLPTNIQCDFIMSDAGHGERKARISHLLGNSVASESSGIISFGSMTINLAAYQVTVEGEPVDFTYLEYALLSFLVQHANHTFSREALLQNVWKFDYYGGPRTVDVHVRRIRAKLGPDLAEYLETIRGVGYLWRSI